MEEEVSLKEDERMTHQRIMKLAHDHGFRLHPLKWDAVKRKRNKPEEREILPDQVVGYVLSKVPRAQRTGTGEGEPNGTYVGYVSDRFAPLPNEVFTRHANDYAREAGAMCSGGTTNWDPDLDWYVQFEYLLPEKGIGWTVENSVDGSTLMRVTPMVMDNREMLPVPEVKSGQKSFIKRKHTTNMMTDVGTLKALIDINRESALEWQQKLQWLVGKPITAGWVKDVKKLKLPRKVLPEWLVDEIICQQAIDGEEQVGSIKDNYITIVRNIRATVVSPKSRMEYMRALSGSLEKLHLIEQILA